MKKHLPTLSLVLLGIGILLTVIGVLAGGAEGVWRKAVTVCLECIGIG